MSQEGEKLNNTTSFSFNGQEISQETVNAVKNEVSQRVNGLLGDISGKVKKGTLFKVNQGPAVEGAPTVVGSNDNGIFKLTVNGQSVLELNLSGLFKQS